MTTAWGRCTARPRGRRLELYYDNNNDNNNNNNNNNDNNNNENL